MTPGRPPADPRPPLLSRWLLRLVTPTDERGELLPDLEDEMRQRAARDGRRAARRWYARQARRSLGPMMAGRLARGGLRGRPGTGLLQDLRLATRALWRSPAFALSTLAMLALGIGAFATVYAFVDAMVLRPLPFGERNERLVTLHSTHPTLVADPSDAGMSYADFTDFGAESTSLEQIEAALGRNVAIATDISTDRVLAASVTPGMFTMLGVEPLLGRTFSPDEGAGAGFETVVVVSHAIWRDMLGGDPAAVGRPIRLNDRELTVIGVMPPGFTFPEEHGLWLPYATSPMAGRQNRPWLAIGLLRDGVDVDQAATELRGVASRLADRYPDTNRDWSVTLFPLRALFGSAHDETTLLAAVSLLLLVTCANVAGLILARGAARRRELTVRAALGARRGRLMRWLVAEAVVLAAAGGALGLLLAGWGLHALVAWMPEPPPFWAVPALDARVIAVALLGTALVAVLSGLAPAWRLSRVGAASALSTGARAAGDSGAHRRLQSLLVVGQAAVSLSLVVGAVLLGQSARALLNADAGFDHDAILSARFYIAGDRYDPIEARTALVDAIVAHVAAIPGVRAAAATGAIPTDDGGADVRLVPPVGARLAGAEVGAQVVPVTPSFWTTLGLNLAEGRTFSIGEAADAGTDVVVVNQRLADVFWPDGSAVGRSLRLIDGGGPRDARVIGIAPDLVYEEFGEVTPQSQLNLYVPYAVAGWRTQALLVAVDPSRPPGSVADAMRAAVQARDPGLAVYDVMPMTARRAYNHWGDRFIGQAMTGLAVAALLLACVGAYGITSYGVALRRREIGVRIAIGATARDIRRLFLATGARLAVAGTLVGLPLALVTARALEAELFRISPWDARVWVVLPAVLAAAILAASYWPARRASRTDPASTLRM